MSALTDAELALQEAERAMRRARHRLEAEQAKLKAPIQEKDVKIVQGRDGVKIYVEHQGSDSLSVVEVKWRAGNLWARVGLRGNFDVKNRPMRWLTTSLRAPEVDSDTLLRRKQGALARWGGR